MMQPRIDVNREQIEIVVASFYARIRQHRHLGPIFSNHVRNWPKHEAKIVDFWASAIRYERTYSGNPMAIHLNASDVEPSHFKVWLEVFDQTLEQHLGAPQKEQWSQLAHRIGRGLCMGVRDFGRPQGAVPRF